jgi:hypothetical protein
MNMQKARYYVPRTKTRGDWYELFYLEKQGYVFVFRDEDKKKPRYLVRVRQEQGEVVLDCQCQGASWYGTCQHDKNSRKYFDFGKVRRVRNFEDKTMEAYLSNYLQNYLKGELT